MNVRLHKEFWPLWRATALAIVVCMSLFLAAPWPRAITANDLKRPEAHQEVSLWLSTLDDWGWHWERKEFEIFLIENSARMAAPIRHIRPMIRPVLQIFGIDQRWGLFTSPDTYPHRLVIDIKHEKGAKFERYYTSLKMEDSPLASALAYRRIRGVYDGNTSRLGRTYGPFTRWVSAQVFSLEPSVQAIRVGFIRTHTTLPGEKVDIKKKPRLMRIHHRSEVMQ